MSRGHERNRQRQRAVSFFGKDLTRRSHAKCELCSVAGESLTVFEIPPLDPEPDFEHCLFVCPTCMAELEGSPIRQPERWRCLNNSVWSETPAIQAAAVMLLRRLQDEHPWAGELLEQVFITDDAQAILDDALGVS